MSIAGKLSSMPFEDLLGWVSASAKTGTLVLEGPEFTKRLVVDDGNLIAAASSNPWEFLGSYLVGWGYISAEELDHAVEMQSQHGMLVGELLVRIGLISQEDLDKILVVVAEEVIFDAFLWTDGRFRFEEGTLPSKRFRRLDLPLVPLLVEGTRRRDELPLIRRQVPSVHHRPRVISAQNLTGLSQDELAIVARADGTKTVESLAIACRCRQFVVWEAVAAAVRAGLVQVLPPDREAAEEPANSFGSVRSLVLSTERFITEHRFDEAWSTIRLISRRFRTASDIDVVISTLKRELEAALFQRGPGPVAVLEIGVLDDSLLETPEGHADRVVLTYVNGTATIAQVLDSLTGDRTHNLLTLIRLIDRGVLETVP